MTAERGAHVIADAASRRLKAGKIVAVLARRRALAGVRLLEIGCGSGHMSAAFATAVGVSGSVTAADRTDARHVRDGFEFRLVAGTALPFEDGRFDVVVSNHVIEHVGDRADQAHHVRELARVLAPSGIGYVAAPSRWTLIEPHYRLPCLSWLPQSTADRYVRWTGRGNWYDVVPITPSTLAELAAAAGLDHENVTHEVAMLTAEREEMSTATRLAVKAPSRLFELLGPIVPVTAFVVHHRPVERLRPR